MLKNKSFFAIILFSIASTSSLSGCSHTPPANPPFTGIPTLVFIQGVHLDASVWNETKSLIDHHLFHSIDLARLGRDDDHPASLKQIATLGCQKIPEGSILVGHSYGGAISNEMVGICPDKIMKIIYVSAVIPLFGEKPFDLMTDDDQKAYGQAVNFKNPKIIPRARKVFFSATDAQVDIRKPLPTLYPEWMSLTGEAIEYTVSTFKTIPKAYIYTTKDPVIAIDTQTRYTDRTRILSTESIKTGHFPMISNPKMLAQLIQKLALAK